MGNFELIKKFVIYVINNEGYLMKDGRIYDSKEHRESRGKPVEFDFDYEAKDFIINNDFGYCNFEIRSFYFKVNVK